jgi:hypothetical protein
MYYETTIERKIGMTANKESFTHYILTGYKDRNNIEIIEIGQTLNERTDGFTNKCSLTVFKTVIKKILRIIISHTCLQLMRLVLLQLFVV